MPVSPINLWSLQGLSPTAAYSAAGDTGRSSTCLLGNTQEVSNKQQGNFEGISGESWYGGFSWHHRRKTVFKIQRTDNWLKFLAEWGRLWKHVTNALEMTFLQLLRDSRNLNEKLVWLYVQKRSTLTEADQSHRNSATSSVWIYGSKEVEENWC